MKSFPKLIPEAVLLSEITDHTSISQLVHFLLKCNHYNRQINRLNFSINIVCIRSIKGPKRVKTILIDSVRCKHSLLDE